MASARSTKRLMVDFESSESGSELKELIAELDEKVAQLNSFDQAEAISVHCDDLVVQVTLTVQSQIEHLSKMEAAMIAQIEEHRQERLKALESETFRERFAPTKQEIETLSSACQALSSKWNASDLRTTHKEINNALEQAQDLILKASLFESRQRDAFSHGSLQFDENKMFLLSKDHIGQLIATSDDQNRGSKINLTLTKPFSTNARIWTQVESLLISDQLLILCYSGGQMSAFGPQDQFELRGHTESIDCLTVLPNGWLASGSADRTIKIWDLDERKLIRTLDAEAELMCALRVMPGGLLASLSRDSTIRVWNPLSASKHLVKKLDRFDLDLVSRCLGALSNGLLVCFSRNSDREGSFLVWDAPKNKLVKSTKKKVWKKDSLYFIVLSNDQVAMRYAKGKIMIFDPLDEKKPNIIVRDGGGLSLFDQLSNGLLVTGVSGNAVSAMLLCDPQNGRLVRRIVYEKKKSCEFISVSRDGHSLGIQTYRGQVEVWSLTQ